MCYRKEAVLAESRPNVLWFLADQFRADAVGAAGNRVIRTPGLDRIAREGILFSRFYVNNPVCMPSRASMFTGRYPSTHGTCRNGIPLRPSEATLASALARAGYATAAIGKVHLGGGGFRLRDGVHLDPESIHRDVGLPGRVVDRFWRSWDGPYYGFQHVQLTTQHGERVTRGGHYGQWIHDEHADFADAAEPERALAPLTGALESWKSGLPVELHHSNWVADRTIRYLESHRDTPFFAFCSFPDPHRPFCPPAPYCDMYDPASMVSPIPNRGEFDHMPPHFQLRYRGLTEQIPYSPGGVQGAVAPDYPLRDLSETHLREIMAHYYGMISLLDSGIARVLDALDRLGLADNTIVLFCSDHGELLGDHGLLYKGPFHYESMIRAPLLIRWPGVAAPGRVHDGLISGVDLMPTLLEVCGAPAEPGVQGQSATGILRGSTEPHRECALLEHIEARRKGQTLGMQVTTLVTSRHKLTYYPGYDFGELFDLSDDPQEYTNLWADPGARELRAELLAQLLEVLCRREEPLGDQASNPQSADRRLDAAWNRAIGAKGGA